MNPTPSSRINPTSTTASDGPRTDQDQPQDDATTPMRAAKQRALVLGGGGSTGNAWLIGVIGGLLRRRPRRHHSRPDHRDVSRLDSRSPTRWRDPNGTARRHHRRRSRTTGRSGQGNATNTPVTDPTPTTLTWQTDAAGCWCCRHSAADHVRRAEWGVHLATQVDELRAGGGSVETIFPDSSAEHMFGAGAMDLSLRPSAARAGYRQGTALAEQLSRVLALTPARPDMPYFARLAGRAAVVRSCVSGAGFGSLAEQVVGAESAGG